MAKKAGAKKRAKLEERAVVEDLDLDVSDVEENYDDEDVVRNRRHKKNIREDDLAAVLPSDAHRLDGLGDDEHGGFLEEEELAVATEKTMRKAAAEADFDVAGVSLGAVSAKKKKASLKDQMNVAPVIEAVERDFASLTTSERLAILKKESPELLKMLDDLKKYLAEVKELAKPLHELLYERKVSADDKNLVSFLETKVQLMLSYCMHVTFYLLLKSEGKKVAGHPVVDNLVEIRVYLEKMWPLEEKLQYSLNRLLSGKSTAAAHLDDLRPVQESGSGLYEATRSVQNTEARDRRKQLREMKEAEELEREENAAMTRVRTKKASALNNTAHSSTLGPMSYREEEDQFFSRITGQQDEDEAGMSLMDALRKRQQQAAKPQEATSARRRGSMHADEEMDEEDVEFDEEEDMDMDMDEDDDVSMDEAEDGDEEMDESNYDALWEEEAERQAEKKAKDAVPREKFVLDEVDRRKAGKKIESHRGLTKARPKDRKTPRVAQRRKYERGMRVHKAQTRTHQPEPEGGFSGVSSIKPGVVRGRKLV